ncbi:chemotaxis protein CheW [Halorhabdus amylolytica]|uniref:chemotaxis protein CheW n=1 Tax=Halorhabdus amylolytica TaxID=2559573 RepID=UPI00200AC58C|nr:chemotaxis protein CheW [Halorhabdus amylolytica]
MSEDDDERMDRARRIRELREGNRGRGNGDEDDAPDGSDAGEDGTAPEDATPADGTDPDSAGDGDDGIDPDSAGDGDDGTDSTANDQETSSGNEGSGATDDGADLPADDGESVTDDGSSTAESEATAPDSNDEMASDEDVRTGNGGDESVPSDDPGEPVDANGDDDVVDPVDANESKSAAGSMDANGDDLTEDDALSAAQAAAAAASEFEGEGGVTMGSDDTDGSATETASDDGAASGEVAPAGATVADADVEQSTEQETRVLEFRLGEELYCLNIEYVEEIVREETVTRVPNTPEYVSGVVDLRGQITTILDPKTSIGMDGGDNGLIIVFDAEIFDDHGAIGWLVDEVNQVTPIVESDVKESPIQEPYINGVIERDDEFVIWTTPELALEVDEDE